MLVVECIVHHLSSSIRLFLFFLKAGRGLFVDGTSSYKFGDEFEIDMVYVLFERDGIMLSDRNHYFTVNREYN